MVTIPRKKKRMKRITKYETKVKRFYEIFYLLSYGYLESLSRVTESLIKNQALIQTFSTNIPVKNYQRSNDADN